ncbi:MAG TPA: hypothetical protein EYO94_07500 [Acidobacteria bacterium]|nr:hypothetical protein [Acidobacteriota bacterium]
MTPDRLLQLFLRIGGTSMLLALVFVVAPRAWMEEIHTALGLGVFPDTPIVWYLARSTSAFYAMMGGLYWLASFDMGRQRLLLLFLGWWTVVLGVMLCGIDLWVGLPLSWTLSEGPVVILMGLALLYLISRTADAHV